MSDATPAEDAEESYVPNDEEGHAAVVEAFEEDKQERQEAYAESLSKKQRLQRARERRTFTVTLFGTEDVTFKRLTGAQIEWLEDLGMDFRGQEAEDDLTNEQLERYREARQKNAEILGDRAQNPEFDADFWAEFEPEFRQEILMGLRAKQTEDNEDQIEFRS